jgi:Fe-S oxidoreductase
MALASATERLEEAEAVLNSKADELVKANIKANELVLVSACPFCKTNFEDAIKFTGKKIRYFDINQLIRDHINTEVRI